MHSPSPPSHPLTGQVPYHVLPVLGCWCVMPSLRVRALIVAFWLVTTAYRRLSRSLAGAVRLWSSAGGDRPRRRGRADRAGALDDSFQRANEARPAHHADEVRRGRRHVRLHQSLQRASLRNGGCGGRGSGADQRRSRRRAAATCASRPWTASSNSTSERSSWKREATAKIAGTVANGQLRATCEVNVHDSGSRERLNATLDPIPVPKGQPLNPLQPVNRIADLRPGRRWVVHESDPLKEIVGGLCGRSSASSASSCRTRSAAA